MDVTRLVLGKDKLARMPEKDRVLLMLMGHIHNEIMVQQKLMLLCEKDSNPIRLVELTNAGQAFVLFRMLVGKLHEAWEFYRKRVSSDLEIRRKYLPLPPEAGAEEHDALNKHFGKDSRLTAIRNKISFHYSDKEKLLEQHFKLLPENQPWEFYLGETRGNTFYYASELLVTAATIGLSTNNTTYRQEDMDELFDVALEVSSKILGLFEFFMIHILEREVPDYTTSEVDIGPVVKASDMTIPFFLDEEDLQRRT